MNRETPATIVRSLLLAAALAGCSGERPAPEGAGIAEAVSAITNPSWTEVGAMSTARQQHTATALQNGKVLVAGGAGTMYYSSAEIYDPATMTFSPTGSMATTRTDHVAVRLASGKVLVAGGDGTGTAELFDPAAGMFSPTGMLTVRRTSAAGVVLKDGTVLLVGGSSSGVPTETVDHYDPGSGTWAVIATMSIARNGHTATLLQDGRVLAAGGVTPTGGQNETTSTAEIYDPKTGTWTPAASMSMARMSFTATLLQNGRVLAAGGYAKAGAVSELGSVEVYDPVLDAWQSAPPMSAPRASHTATALASGAVLVTGGLDASDSALPTAEIFDPATATWHPIAPMAHTRILHTATPLADGTVLVAGGEQQSSAEVFHLAALAAPCDTDKLCASNHCSDGVCCLSDCTGTCFSCALPGSMGVCTQATPGTDPRRACSDGGACEPTCGASGACTSRVGQACTPGGCTPDGTGHFAAAVCVAGQSTCPIEVTACGDAFRCDADAGACRTDCRSVDDCAVGYACDLSGRCVEPAADTSSAPACAGSPLGGGVPAGAAGGVATLVAGLLARRAARRRGGRGRA